MSYYCLTCGKKIPTLVMSLVMPEDSVADEIVEIAAEESFHGGNVRNGTAYGTAILLVTVPCPGCNKFYHNVVVKAEFSCAVTDTWGFGELEQYEYAVMNPLQPKSVLEPYIIWDDPNEQDDCHE